MQTRLGKLLKNYAIEKLRILQKMYPKFWDDRVSGNNYIFNDKVWGKWYWKNIWHERGNVADDTIANTMFTSAVSG